METLLSRWRLSFDYYWPHLEILHNPPSQIHWLKALHALEASEFESFIVSIPPCLAIAAARYGMAKLGNSAALREIALNTILDPMDWEDWKHLLAQFEPALAQYLKSQIARMSGKGIETWRPLGYEAPTANQGAQNTTTHLFSCKQNAKLELLRSEALKYLEYLRQVHFDHPAMCSQRARDDLEISFKSVALNTIEKTDRNCAICCESLLDPETRKGPLREAASQQLDLAKKRYTFLDLPENLNCWMQRLKKYNQLDLQAGLTKRNKAVMKELTQFTYGLICAHHRRQPLLQGPLEDGCSGPVKLSCGHVFGTTCIETWLEEHTTCPCCRRNISPVMVKRDAIYSEHQSFTQVARRQDSRLLLEFPIFDYSPMQDLINQLISANPLDKGLVEDAARETSLVLRDARIHIARIIQHGLVAEALRIELTRHNYRSPRFDITFHTTPITPELSTGTSSSAESRTTESRTSESSTLEASSVHATTSESSTPRPTSPDSSTSKSGTPRPITQDPSTPEPSTPAQLITPAHPPHIRCLRITQSTPPPPPTRPQLPDKYIPCAIIRTRPSKNARRKAVGRRKRAQAEAEKQRSMGQPTEVAWERTRLSGPKKAKEENNKRVGLSQVTREDGRLGDGRKFRRADRGKYVREKKGLKRFERIGEPNGKKDLERDKDVIYERAMNFYDGLDRP